MPTKYVTNVLFWTFRFGNFRAQQVQGWKNRVILYLPSIVRLKILTKNWWKKHWNCISCPRGDPIKNCQRKPSLWCHFWARYLSSRLQRLWAKNIKYYYLVSVQFSTCSEDSLAFVLNPVAVFVHDSSTTQSFALFSFSRL